MLIVFHAGLLPKTKSATSQGVVAPIAESPLSTVAKSIKIDLKVKGYYDTRFYIDEIQ